MFRSNHKSATVGELREAMNGVDFELLDVREQSEYDGARVEPSTLIPLGELQKRAGEIGRDKPVFVLCRSGQRAVAAAQALEAAGLADVRVVEGGILAWARAGYPVIEGKRGR